MADNLTSEWYVGGDFNYVLSATDTGGNSGLSRDYDRFTDCLLECGLQDLGFKGQPFTWQKGIIKRRLDRYVTNAAWSQRFSSTVVKHLPKLKSDHVLIFLELWVDSTVASSYRLFRCKWISYGDHNISYFHNLATARRCRNRVTMLKNQHGDWVDDTVQLQHLGINHFLSLYTDDQPYEKLVASGMFSVLTSEEVGHLDRMVVVEEVSAALFFMGAWKAPGPDDLFPMCGDDTIPLMKPLQRMSNAWKGWFRSDRGFLEHHWIPSVHCLMDFAQTEVTTNMRDEKVCDYIVNNNWNYDRIGYNLGDDWLSIFASMKPPEVELSEDSIAWILTLNVVFSIKSACSALFSPASTENASIFTRIWKLEGLQRLRSFCWLVANNALLTNEERVRRNIPQSALCGVCGNNSESLLQVLRDCPVAYRTWKSIDDRLDPENFFTKPLIPWLMENLSFQLPFKGVLWPLLFASTLNFLLFRRNTFVFNKDRVPDEGKIHEIAWYMAQDYHRAQSESMRSRRRVGTFAEMLITWQSPPPPFIKLNSDGSVSKDDRAACGGILRDSNGQFLACYSANLGACTVTTAEL
ncbi:hypothetical protein Ahy_B04g069826 [Arachis hypogaea]|uniref:Reverse transcriptase zinc-binding domain-containing protein n=1 Tax=Arachis hypogaea TaxID=3818 RepID=A0A444ZDM8_ARAHY|nr:hypothetical protein Ahy_B04g069826 [Arachis hypogaea]